MNSGRYQKITIIFLLILIFLPSAWGQSPNENRIDKKYGVLFSGSWNSLRNEKLNDEYIESWSSWGALDDKINSGYGFSSEILYFPSRKISISAGLVYIDGSTKKDSVFYNLGGDSIETDDYVNTRLYAPTFSIRYHINLDDTDFTFGVGESILFGKVSRHHTIFSPFRGDFILKNDYHSTGIGFRFFCGLHYRFNSVISYIMEGGYRHFKTGDLVDKETKAAMRSQFFTNTVPPINLDYTGPYISAGLMFRLF